MLAWEQEHCTWAAAACRPAAWGPEECRRGPWEAACMAGASLEVRTRAEGARRKPGASWGDRTRKKASWAEGAHSWAWEDRTMEGEASWEDRMSWKAWEVRTSSGAFLQASVGHTSCQ